MKKKLNDQKTFEEIPYDKCDFVRRDLGDYGTIEYLFKGQLGMYRIRVMQSVVDDGKVLAVYQNNKPFLNIFVTKERGVFVGKEEDEGEFYIFRVRQKKLDIFKRKYDF